MRLNAETVKTRLTDGCKEDAMSQEHYTKRDLVPCHGHLFFWSILQAAAAAATGECTHDKSFAIGFRAGIGRESLILAYLRACAVYYFDI